MEKTNNKRIEELEKEINELPKGCISKKKIGDKEYFYHRFSESNKKYEKYISKDDVKELENRINKRKELEKELKELKGKIKKSTKSSKNNEYVFKTYVKINDELKSFIKGVEKFKKRDVFNNLKEYIYNESIEKVLILYGLRRTGKTTLIRQMILDLKDELDKVAFIQIRLGKTLNDINQDLKYLESKGYKYIFIDEVTLMEDFIEGAALFSDIYATSGMKIVLTGTDSLGFIFTEKEELFDRAIFLHTTFISYHEFERVLGIKGIDEYIKYAGTMSISGNNYNYESIFQSPNLLNEYVDSAISKNIQHSLKYYDNGNHFRDLYDLYINNELTNAINRVIQDINHRFTVEVLTKEYKSDLLMNTNRNLIKDRKEPFDLLNNIDYKSVINEMKKMLDIIDVNESKVKVNYIHALEIKEYLLLLDLIDEIDVIYYPNVNEINKKIVVSQSGLRYEEASSLIDSLLHDKRFNDLSILKKDYVKRMIESTLKGRMMEDIILLESKIALKNKKIFQLQFARGEYDMVIFDSKTLSSEIYEIKYSKEVVSNQSIYLKDEELLKNTEFHFGKITKKAVIYRGESFIQDDIHYINVEEYLNGLYE